MRPELATTDGIEKLNDLGFVLAVVVAVLLIGVSESVTGKNETT